MCFDRIHSTRFTDLTIYCISTSWRLQVITEYLNNLAVISHIIDKCWHSKKKWYESHKENCAEWNFETLSYLQLTRGYGGINKNVMYINWNTNKAFMWKKMKRIFFLKTIFSGGKTVHWNKGWFYHMYNVGK